MAAMRFLFRGTGRSLVELVFFPLAHWSCFLCSEAGQPSVPAARRRPGTAAVPSGESFHGATWVQNNDPKQPASLSFFMVLGMVFITCVIYVVNKGVSVSQH